MLLTLEPGKDRDRGVSLIELLIGIFVATLLLIAAINWLISANRTVSISTAKAINNSAAQNVIDQIDASLRFASGAWISSNSKTLYVQNGTASNPPKTCIAWVFNGSSLSKEGATGSSVIASGVSNYEFSRAASPYDGLVSVAFTLNQASTTQDAAGVTIDETLSASNMASPVSIGSCSPLT
jgi:Tfp pilus assembly protein PilW